MSTMAPATQPTLEDVLTHMSAQIAALTREVKELRALKEDVDELRAFNDARIVQQEDLGVNHSDPECCNCTTQSPLRSHPAPGRPGHGGAFPGRER
jgi:hypothetical protein